MKRFVLVLFALTVALAVPLAGCGLINAAGSILVGGGGLGLALIAALAFGAARPQAKPRTRVAKPAPAAVVASPAPAAPVAPPAPAADLEAAVDFGAAELEFFAEGEKLADEDASARAA